MKKKIEIIGIVPVKANSDRVKKKILESLVIQIYLNLN